MIPDDWEVVSVQQLVEKQILKKPLDGNHGNIHPKSSDYVGYGIPFVMANNFTHGQVDLLSCKFITKERADKLQKGFSISGDVLLTHKGTVGSTAIVGELNTDYIMLTPQVTYYRVTNDNCLNNQFLRHYFDSQPFQSLFINLAGGGTRAYLGIVKQLALPVVTPPLSEQRSIATALSDMDELLGGLDQLITKKRDLKQSAMQQLLTGKTRLSGFGEGKNYKQTEIGLIPEDWILTPLSKISAFITKGSTPTTYGFTWTQDGILFLRSECVSENGLDLSQSMFISQQAHSALKRSSLRSGDLLITITGNVGRVVYLDKDFNMGNMNQHIARVRIIDNCVCTKFIYHYLNQSTIRKAFNTITTGQAYPQISLKQVRDAVVPLSSIEEQNAIASILSDMDTEIAALEQRRNKTRDLKQAMMQELLTGRIRLL